MIYTISIWLLPAIIAITFHEAAHAFVARALGDDTASRLGRVSLNPVKHIDPVGTILLFCREFCCWRIHLFCSDTPSRCL
jgi:Zn-dependent protease